MFQPPLKGLIAATPTPLDADGRVDSDAIGPLIDYVIQSGVSGVYACGSTGEGMSLSGDERRRVAEETVAAAGGRIPVIVQVGHNCLSEARELARHAQSAGADVISATCPSYFKVTDVDTLINCMAEIASGAPELPFYYYHIPGLTGSPIDVAQFLCRAPERIPTLVGMKYTHTLLHQYVACSNVRERSFDVVWGCDEMLLGALSTGAKAAIGSTYNVAAPIYLDLLAAFDDGDLDKARALQAKSVAMIEVMQSYPFHAALKSMLGMLGVPVGACRLPLKNMTAEEHATLRSKLDSLGFFESSFAIDASKGASA